MVLDVKKEARRSALKKGKKLKEEIRDYLDAKESIPLGLNMKDEFAKNKQRILGLLGAKEKDWNNVLELELERQLSRAIGSFGLGM